MKRLILISLTILVLVPFLANSNANATNIRVSQELSPGVGDFDSNILGFINPFSTGLTTSAFYQYNNPNGASYNGELNGGPNPVSSLSQFFLLNATDGLSLVAIHDNVNDDGGAITQTRWNLTGDTAAVVLSDDPGETTVVSGGGTQFDSNKATLGCCTDGYAIGSLDGNWTMFGQFLTTPSGITNWAAISSDFTSISLILRPELRVRLDTVDPIPEPATMLLLGTGLVGVAGAARRRKKKKA